jgi:hypothetical protein
VRRLTAVRQWRSKFIRRCVRAEVCPVFGSKSEAIPTSPVALLRADMSRHLSGFERATRPPRKRATSGLQGILEECKPHEVCKIIQRLAPNARFDPAQIKEAPREGVEPRGLGSLGECKPTWFARVVEHPDASDRLDLDQTKKSPARGCLRGLEFVMEGKGKLAQEH